MSKCYIIPIEYICSLPLFITVLRYYYVFLHCNYSLLGLIITIYYKLFVSIHYYKSLSLFIATLHDFYSLLLFITILR